MAAANGHLDIVEYLISQGVVRVHACFTFQVSGELGFWVKGWWVLWKVDSQTQGEYESKNKEDRIIERGLSNKSSNNSFLTE